jgi:uncharacterized membrane protein
MIGHNNDHGAKGLIGLSMRMSPEKAFRIIGPLFGILFLLVTPPFQVPDEPYHFARAFHVSELGILAEKLDCRGTPDASYLIRKDGRFIKYGLKQNGKTAEGRSVFEAVPPDAAKTAMHYVGRALITGEEQIMTFQVREKGGLHKYELRIVKKGEDECLADVKDITFCEPRVGAFVPKSIVITARRVMGKVAFHPEEKQNIAEIRSLLNLPLARDHREFVEFRSQALYTPVPYVPQALGIAAGSVLNLSPLIIFYMGRAANLLTWLFLVSLSIRTTPVSKWLFFLLALTPMSLSLASSLSPDCLTNGAAFLLTAFFLRYSLDETKMIRRVDLLIILLLSLVLSLSKQVYCLIVLLFLLIPERKFATKKRYFVTFALICLSSGVALAIWFSLTKGLYVPSHTGVFVSPDEQMRLIAADPMNFWRIIAGTFQRVGEQYIEEFVGTLGWLDTLLPDLLIFSYLAILIFTALSDNRKEIRISCQKKGLMGFVFLSITFLICASQYLLWTEVGENIIEGIQGRYFIPVSPLFFLFFYHNKIAFRMRTFVPVIPTYSVFALTWTAVILLKRYYL